jgi:EmrB/QacA subfamily drug resistance transporter
MSHQPVTRLSQQLGIIFSGSFAGFMVMLDNNIVNISLPYISKYFAVGTSVVVQITLVYFLMLSGTIILFGKLADKYGVKKIFVTGFIIFTVSSLLCGLSPSFHVLLAARALQGIGGSMLYSTAISLISIYIPAEKRGWAFGIFSPINSLGVLVGSPLGGLITGLLNWHWIFLVNVPVGIAAILVALRQIPADLPREETGKKSGFDFFGTMLSFVGLVILVYVLNQGRKLGYESPVFIGGIALSIASLAGFIIRELKAKDPLLDLSIFRDRNFSLALFASLVAMGLLAGNSILMPFYLTYILKIKIELAGFVLMINPVIFSILSVVIGTMSDRVSRTRLTTTGMVIALLGCTGFIFLIPQVSLFYIAAYCAVQGIAYSFFITPNNNLVMSLAPAGKQSVSSSVFRLSTNLGQIMGILVMESMFTLAFPPHEHVTSQMLKSLPAGTLLNGFQFSYIGGAILCLAALLLSVFVKDTERKATSGEPALTG